MENIYVQFDGMVYQQIVGIPMGTNCASLITDLFLYCYERDFMSNLQQSKRFDLIGSAQEFYAAFELTRRLTKLDVICIFF